MLNHCSNFHFDQYFLCFYFINDVNFHLALNLRFQFYFLESDLFFNQYFLFNHYFLIIEYFINFVYFGNFVNFNRT